MTRCAITGGVLAVLAILIVPRKWEASQALFEAGAIYHIWDGSLEGDDPTVPVTARFVCDWSIPEAEIDRFLDFARNAS